jgi:hypothetical protein
MKEASGESILLKKIVSGVMFAALLLSVVVSLGVIVPTASAGSDGWWNSSWRFRRNVIVENPNSFALRVSYKCYIGHSVFGFGG